MGALIAMKFSVTATLLICVVLITPGWAQRIQDDSNLNVNSRPCSEDHFTCRNGECIVSELLCDGRADCEDQSDETQVECTKPELTCPDFTFRCGYGACVNGDAACNGVKDCVDNSDETLARCPGKSSVRLEQSCGDEEHRCENGQCISSTLLCDGAVDCMDGTDETFAHCGSFPCKSITFRCNYGACIDDDLRCNTVPNCADNSDEDPQLCSHPDPEPSLKPDPLPPGSSSCRVPPQPTNGRWMHNYTHCNGYGGMVNCNTAQGFELGPGKRLVYSCDPGYMVNGNADIYCTDGGRWSSLPVCVETKCGTLNSASISADCFNGSGHPVNCDFEVRPQTMARLTCRAGYKPDTDIETTKSTDVECNAMGKWEPYPITCTPECGKTIIRQKPLVVNGTRANVTEFPWHASLYQENPSNKSIKDYICGATIIRTNLVLTAAHCVYEDSTQKTQDPRKLFIATGNMFRDYDYAFHDKRIVSKHTVKNVIRHCSYYGFDGSYASDIALLELQEPFKFSDRLLPACLDSDDKYGQILEEGSSGRVAGFGRTATGATSFILQTITIPYIPYRKCQISRNAETNRRFIGSDKFCAGHGNGSAVCDGDSGGGLVFDIGERWYVMGIVSSSIGTNYENAERTCDSYAYTLFTKVSSYRRWIRNNMLAIQHNRPIPPCVNFN